MIGVYCTLTSENIIRRRVIFKKKKSSLSKQVGWVRAQLSPIGFSLFSWAKDGKMHETGWDRWLDLASLSKINPIRAFHGQH